MCDEIITAKHLRICPRQNDVCKTKISRQRHFVVDSNNESVNTTIGKYQIFNKQTVFDRFKNPDFNGFFTKKSLIRNSLFTYPSKIVEINSLSKSIFLMNNKWNFFEDILRVCRRLWKIFLLSAFILFSIFN